MRELDLLLEEFLENRYEVISEADREGFERLLECRNEDLMDWLMEGEDPQDQQLASIVRQVREAGRPGADYPPKSDA
jgi:succinate dehydrogenase flavin-adding protein (antitoxin of CptAB toxin-antitoxin module)